MVGFAGYAMPVQYQGIIAEHHQCRQHAALFDVSHMGQASLPAASSSALERVVTGDIAGLKPGRQRYTLLTNAEGGIVDDLMAARLGERLMLVLNAANKQADADHIRAHLPETAALTTGFDRALLATGCRLRRLQVPGEDLPGVLYLRTLPQARALREGLRRARDVVVVGGGFIGLEVAAAARQLGKPTLVLEALEVPLGRVLGEEPSQAITALHTGRGTRIETRAEVAAFEGDARGVVSERALTELARHFGFSITRVRDLPSSTRSVTELRNRTIFVAQRTDLPPRAARSVIAQTLGHFALGHGDPVDYESYVRQRVEANYFAGALLAPERALVPLLAEARDAGDLSVEDVRDVFYVSYEMAAHRMTNLLTRHFAIPVHFQRSNPEGILWKAYENDGVPLPKDRDGSLEGQRLCRRRAARAAVGSADPLRLH